MKIVTMSTLGTGRLVANLLASCQILGIDSDVELYCDRSFLRYAPAFNTELRMHVTVHELPQLTASLAASLSSDPVLRCVYWGSRDFLSLVRAKLDLLVELSHPNRFEPFLYLDADTVFLNRLPQVWPNILTFQSDARDFMQSTLESGDSCMGCFWCPTPAGSVWLLAMQWIEAHQPAWRPSPSENYFDDQTAVNAVLPSLGRRTGIFEPSLWLNGARAFDLPQDPGVAPILVHANWRVGARRKEAELRSRGWWFASDESLARCGL